MFVRLYVYVYMYTCIHVCIYNICMYVSMYLYVYICIWFWKQLFPRANQKNKKKSFETLCGQTPKRWVFWFSLGKRWLWTGKPTFSQENDGFGQKNQLFPREKRKRWFGAGKPNFFLGKTKQTIILDFGRIVSQKFFFFRFFWFSIGKSWFSFIFSLGASWFFCPKPFFPRENQKTIFLESGRIVCQKIFFLFFWFSLGKVGF